MLGETFNGKWPSLFVKITELSNVIVRKSGGGFFSIVCSPETYSLLQCGHMDYEYSPRHVKGITYKGVLEGEWKVYTDIDMEPGKLLIGSSQSATALSFGEPKKYAVLVLANFIERDEKESVEEIIKALQSMKKWMSRA
jgi:hypothetical protein